MESRSRHTLVAVLAGALVLAHGPIGIADTTDDADDADEVDEVDDIDNADAPVEDPEEVWHPGIYHGLTVGVSTRTDMVAALGDPSGSGAVKDDAVWFYNVEDPAPGTLVVTTEETTEVIRSIVLRPRALSRDEMLEMLGDEVVETHYGVDGCLSREEKMPLYERENGPLVFFENRAEGIAVSLAKDGNVRDITYVGGPIGAKESRCTDLPIVISASMPFYPDMARRARVEGIVRLRVTTDGARVEEVVVIGGPPLLTESARRNVETWEFGDGRARELEVTFHYVLESESSHRAGGSVTIDFPYMVEVRAKVVEF